MGYFWEWCGVPHCFFDIEYPISLKNVTLHKKNCLRVPFHVDVNPKQHQSIHYISKSVHRKFSLESVLEQETHLIWTYSERLRT